MPCSRSAATTPPLPGSRWWVPSRRWTIRRWTIRRWTMAIPSETLTPNQAARRSRVIDAAMALAAEGGYDAVQMRDVATRAQVALGTIYRYFSSKDHLLAACQVELWQAQVERLAQRPPDGVTPADRVISF